MGHTTLGARTKATSRHAAGRRFPLTISLIVGMAVSSAGGGGSAPPGASPEGSSRVAEAPAGIAMRVGSVRPEHHRGSVHASGSSAAARKALASKPTIDLTGFFDWRPDEPTITADPAGRPWVNLEPGLELRPVFAGEAKTLERLDRELGEPLALASADFDEDGIPDLVTTYASEDAGGFVTLHIGNPDSIYPHAPEARQRKAAGTFTDDPFLTPALVFEAPVAPAWVGAGDFDADGHQDLVLAGRGGSSLHHLPGDGRGGFGAAREIPLDGYITAMTVGEVNRRDGLEDVVVGIEGRLGPAVLVYQSPAGALDDTPESIAIAERVHDLVLGQLDDGFARDLVVLTAEDALVVHGRDRRLGVEGRDGSAVRGPIVTAVPVPFVPVSVAVGDVAGSPGQELAALGGDGTIAVMRPDIDAGWVETMRMHLPSPSPSKTGSARPKLLTARISSLPKKDLVVLDPQGSRLLVAMTDLDVPAPAGAVPIAVGAVPRAVLPMRLNADSLADLVVLTDRGTASVAKTAVLATFNVNRTDNDGDYDTGDGRCDVDRDTPGDQCTLSAAITQANSSPGADLITFSVSSVERATAVQEAVTIDGTTAGMVEIQQYGLSVSSGGSTIRGLATDRLNLSNVGDNIIEGCNLGVHPDGVSTFGSGGLNVPYEVSDSLIGGTAPAARNVIYGRVTLSAPNTRFKGNYVGITASGSSLLEGDAISHGVDVRPATADSILSGVTIGGDEPGAGNVITCTDYSIEVRGSGTTPPPSDLLIQGNYIGLDADGAVDLTPDAGGGIDIFDAGGGVDIGGTTANAGNVVVGVGSTVRIWDDVDGSVIRGNLLGTDATGMVAITTESPVAVQRASGAVIGGAVEGAGNVIAAGDDVGIYVAGALEGDPDGGTVIQGNFIGTDVTGTASLANREDGIYVSAMEGTIIGGTTAAAGNLVSGNGENGIFIAGFFAPDTVIQGNLIGTDVTGLAALGNGEWGIRIHQPDFTVGGSGDGEGNVISGNGYGGIIIDSPDVENLSIEGNLIGLGSDGVKQIGNARAGVLVYTSGSGCVIGGVDPGAGNLIAHNGGPGVHLQNGRKKGTTIVGNSIFSNDGLGIDLDTHDWGEPPDGVTANDDLDADEGPNGLQNYPVLSAADGGVLQGRLDSEPNATYTIDVYSSPSCDPSGHGEGKKHLGSADVSTASDGSTGFAIGIGGLIDLVTATATAPDGSTSEFSNCIDAGAGERTLRIKAQTPIDAGTPLPVTIEVLAPDGEIDLSYDGAIEVSLDSGTTEDLALLKDVDGIQEGSRITIEASAGVANLSIQTPREELTRESVIGYTTVLEGTIKLRARLSGDTVATKTIKVNSPLDFWIERVEVQQGTRVTPNETAQTFVKNRQLLVRVYLRSNVDEFDTFKYIEQAWVKVALRNGQGNLVFGPSNLGVSALKGGTRLERRYIHRRDQNYTPDELRWGLDSLNTVLPEKHFKYDKMTIEVETDTPYPDKRPENNTTSLGPLRFVDSEPVTYLYSRTRLEDFLGTVDTRFPSNRGILLNINRWIDMNPVSKGRFEWIKQPDQAVDEDPILDYHPEETLTMWFSAIDLANVVAWVHFVDNDYIGEVWEDGIAGYARFNSHSAVVDADLALPPHHRHEVATHELGHIMALGDTYDDPKAQARPLLNPRRSDATRDGNRVEPGAFAWYFKLFEVAGDAFQMTDFMGAGQLSWFDRPTWEYMRDAFLPVGKGGDHRKLGLLAKDASAKAVESLILVRGAILLAGGAQLAPFYTIEGAGLRSDPGSGDYAVETVDSGGAVLDRVAFEPAFTVLNVGVDLDRAEFDFGLPFSSSVAEIRVVEGTNVLASRAVQGSSPTVQFTSIPGGTVEGTRTVSWSGSDPDGDDLLYSLFYSPDGALKMPIIVETSSTSVDWKTDEYPGSDSAELTLVATDGVFSTSLDSGPLELPDRPPEVEIFDPLDGAKYKPDTLVLLVGGVLDAEDGYVADAALQWTSSRDGALGMGTEVEAESLSIGTHDITASYTDSGGNQASAVVSIEITNGPVCELQCEPEVPLTAAASTQVEFRSGVTKRDCSDPVSTFWSFGDGHESTAANPKHSYDGGSFFSWHMNARSGTVSCDGYGMIAVDVPTEYAYLIPASAHTPGAEGTNWVSDMVVFNGNQDAQWTTLAFHEVNLDNTATDPAGLFTGGGQSFRIDDVVGTWFGAESTSGAIRVASTEPLIVSSRTYNDAAGGTFGQYVPGMPESEAIEAGEEVRLIQLTRNDDFRTNIGFASLVSSVIDIRVDLYRSDASWIRGKTYPVEPYSYRQINDIIGKLAGGDVDEAYAVVRSDTAGARYFAYASVVDNRSGDPVMILPVASSAASSGACVPDSWVSLDPQGDFVNDRFYGSFSAGNRHFFIGDFGLIITTTTDGSSWNTVQSGTEEVLLSGAWNGSRYVIVGGVGTLLTSPNGNSWTLIDLGHTRGIVDIAWGNGVFVAVGYGGTIITSPDGVTWTPRNAGTTHNLRGIAWNGSTFVVVGYDWDGNDVVLTSPNGISWTTRTPASGPGWYEKIAWGSGTFVAVGTYGDIATSPDGIGWTARTSGVSSDLKDVIWDGSQFVAVGGSVRVLTSPDGVAWTSHPFGPTSSLNTVLWTGGRHVVASSSGAIFGTPLCSPNEPLWITAGAHSEGVGGTYWVTDLEIHNPDDDTATVTVDLLPKGTNNTSHESEELSIAPGRSFRVADVMDSLFGYTGAAALRISSRGAAVMVGSRTYNTAASGTFGQFVPGVPESEAVAGGSVRLVQLSRSASVSAGFRTNIGFVNVGAEKIEIMVELYDGAGTLLGSTQHNVKPYGQNQVTDIFGRVTSGDVANGYAIVSSSDPGSRFIAYASVVDNRSGDPIYIPAN